MGKKKQEAPRNTTVSAATLVTWRERMGYTPEDACEALGCAKIDWSRWEAGNRPVPYYIGLACSALALGMTAYGEEKGA